MGYEADHVVEAEPTQMLVALLITESSVSEHGDLHVVRQGRLQTLQDFILVAVSPPFHRRLVC